MKTKLKTTIVSLLILSTLNAFAGEGAKFDAQDGGTAGKGILSGVPFAWVASKAIDKTLATDIRTKDFGGGALTFSFESPVSIESIGFHNVNRASENKITFYAADGTVIVPQGVRVTSQEGFTDFPGGVKDGALGFQGAGNSAGNYSAVIALLPPVSGVSKAVLDVKQEEGLLDLSLSGSPSLGGGAEKAGAAVAVSQMPVEKLNPLPPAAPPFRKTSPEVKYKALFNHDGVICYSFTKGLDPKTTGPEYIGGFARKLKNTDVDVVLVCPNLGRSLAYPSAVNPMWMKVSSNSALKGHDYIKEYIRNGGDPVRDILEAAHEIDRDCFISFRMNEAHSQSDKNFPTHDDFFRNHPEYWLADTDTSTTWKWDDDQVRMHNYMLEPVRDWYFAQLEEMATYYDLDGLELDFQRAPRFFYNHEMEEGKKVMTGFVKRVREMVDRIAKERGKSIKLSVRVPETIEKCNMAGLDVVQWDELGLVHMINMSPYYLHSLNIDIEGFKAKIKNAKLYAELEGWSQAIDVPKGSNYNQGNRLTPATTYRAAALNFLSRGADGISFFNYDYLPHGSPQYHEARVAAAKELKGITDVEHLKTLSKNYVMIPFQVRLMQERNKGVKDEYIEEVVIPDDTSKVKFSRAILRVETLKPSNDLNIEARLNGKALEPCEHEGTELVPPVFKSDYGYPTADKVKFYNVPLTDIIPGKNRIEARNLDKAKRSCELFSMELYLSR
jgi:hypothetical protein